MKRVLAAVFLLLGAVAMGSAQQTKAGTAPEFSNNQPQVSTEIVTPERRVRLSPEATAKLRVQLNEVFQRSPQSNVPQEVITPQGRVRISPEMAQKLRKQLNYAFEVATVPENICYTMHSFVFKRYNGGDATRLVKQTTCTPASQFNVKKGTETKPK